MAGPGTIGEIVSPTHTVSRWVEAFNARDLAGMLACLSREVDYHPLRLGGVYARYHGHDGVRRWFAQLQLQRHHLSVSLSDVQDLGAGCAFATGSLNVDKESEIGPFCALHRVVDGVAISAHHYLTDPDMIEQLGLLRP